MNQKKTDTTSSGWNKSQIDALQARFDQSMPPDISKEGVIPKTSSKPTYSRDPPGPEIRTGSYLSILSGEQDVSTPFLIQQDTDLPPPPPYPGTGNSSDHYTSPAIHSVSSSIHQELPYTFREPSVINKY